MQIFVLCHRVTNEASHDVGDDQHGTGYDAILWVEENVVTQNFRSSVTRFHTRQFLSPREVGTRNS